MPTVVEPAPVPTSAPPAPADRPALRQAPPAAYEPFVPPSPPHPQAVPPGRPAPALSPAEQEWERQWDDQAYAEPLPTPVPWTERARRGLLVTAGAVAVGAACAAAPWVAAAGLVLVVWLLRSGSLAAGAVGDKRRLRGRKWYDGAQLVVKTPWHLVQSLPGTLGLLLWSGGLAVAAALLCYAVALGLATTLFASGLVLAASLWWGPGGSRVRGPLTRVAHPLSRGVGPWVATLAVLALVTLGLGLRVAADGVSWLPASERPFASFEIPDGGILSR